MKNKPMGMVFIKDKPKWLPMFFWKRLVDRIVDRSKTLIWKRDGGCK